MTWTDDPSRRRDIGDADLADDGIPETRLPGWSRTFRRAGIVAFSAAVALGIIAFLSGWTSPFELARTLLVGGILLLGAGMLLGLGATGSASQHSMAHPTIPPALLDTPGMSSRARHSILYDAMVPTWFAGFLLIAVGIFGVRYL